MQRFQDNAFYPIAPKSKNVETRLDFLKTLTSEVLRHEFCRSIGGWCDAKGKREAEKMNALNQEATLNSSLPLCLIFAISILVIRLKNVGNSIVSSGGGRGTDQSQCQTCLPNTHIRHKITNFQTISISQFLKKLKLYSRARL